MRNTEKTETGMSIEDALSDIPTIDMKEAEKIWWHHQTTPIGKVVKLALQLHRELERLQQVRPES